ncbi:MAG TPA: hypothetical protein VF516_41105, partial [Kofleriaceae bacterium]
MTLTAKHAAAQWFLCQLKLKQPQVNVHAWYDADGTYVVVADNAASARSLDGESLDKWIQTHKPIGLQLRLADSPPNNSEKLPEQSLEQFLLPAGPVIWLRDLYAELAFLVPRDFPEFKLESGSGTLDVIVERPLSESETSTLASAMAAVQITRPYSVRVEQPFASDSFRLKIPGDLRLLPSRDLPREAGRALRHLYEEDEDRWKDARDRLYSSESTDPSHLLPSSWAPGPSRCVLPTSVFEAHNIRNYLSLYREVVLTTPLLTSHEQIFASLSCSEQELCRLAAAGRVRF